MRRRILSALLLTGGPTMALLLAQPAEESPCITDTASGAQVCQITNVGENKIIYYDVPTYSVRYGKIVYEHQQAGRIPEILAANLDGSDARVLTPGRAPTVNPDGTKVYYISGSGRGEPGTDIFSFDLGNGHITRVTHVDARGILQRSPPVASPKGDVLVYAVDNVAHEVYGDGSGATPLKFGDPYPNLRFHRLRISPTHPNLILYNREIHPPPHSEKLHQPLFPLWVYDTETGRTYEPTEIATHMVWAPDGIHISYNGGGNYRRHSVHYDGTGDRVLNPGPGQFGGFTEYCAFAPEGDVLACANSDITGRSPLSGSIFLLATDGSDRIAYVCKHNAKMLNYWGYPALIFTGDRYHLAFRSDATGSTQVYTVTLPKDIYSRMRLLANP